MLNNVQGWQRLLDQANADRKIMSSVCEPTPHHSIDEEDLMRFMKVQTPARNDLSNQTWDAFSYQIFAHL